MYTFKENKFELPIFHTLTNLYIDDIGALYDATGNYNYSFYMAGSTLAMSGIINLPLRRIAAYLERKHEQENNRSECVPISNGKV